MHQCMLENVEYLQVSMSVTILYACECMNGICIYMRTQMCMYASEHKCLHIYMCSCEQEYFHVNASVCMWGTCGQTFTYMFMSVHLYKYACEHMNA